MLRDIEADSDAQLRALREILTAVSPDILLLTKVDFDAEKRTLGALQGYLGFKHAFALAPNSMHVTPLDLNGDGLRGDRQTWVRYAGEGAMALLSQYPVELSFHMNDLLWKDLRGAHLPQLEANAYEHLRLVTQGLWVVRVHPPHSAPVTLLAFQNYTPAFDGPEDFNGKRNRDQLELIRQIVRGEHGPFPGGRFIVVGNTNLDPLGGDGARGDMTAFLADPMLQDPKPESKPGQRYTAFWEKPGPMRVSYILPSADWSVTSAGVFWPEAGPLSLAAQEASRHRLVWVDLMP